MELKSSDEIIATLLNYVKNKLILNPIQSLLNPSNSPVEPVMPEYV